MTTKDKKNEFVTPEGVDAQRAPGEDPFDDGEDDIPQTTEVMV